MHETQVNRKKTKTGSDNPKKTHEAKTYKIIWRNAECVWVMFAMKYCAQLWELLSLSRKWNCICDVFLNLQSNFMSSHLDICLYWKCHSKTKQQTQTQSLSSFLSDFLSLPVHSHYLYGHMLAAFWEWYAKSGEGVLGATAGGGRCLHPFRRPASPPTLHLSPLLRTRAIQRPFLTFELWECSLAALAAVKETHPCLSRFTPVLPVALLLWCCAPAPLVSAVGSCPGSNLSTWPSPNQSSCVTAS